MADPSRHHTNPQDLSAQDRTTHGSVYRDETSVLAGRRAALQRDYQRQVAELPRDLITAYARRVARIWFGVVAAAGGVAMFGVAAYRMALGHFGPSDGGPTWILLATWGAALLAYAVARKLAARELHAELARIAAPSDDASTDITRLQIYTPVKRTVSLIDRKERASVAWPLIGLAFIGPLSLHGLVALLLQVSAADFAAWIQLSAILVGHCHVIVVVFAVLFARQVRRLPLEVSILAVAPWTKVFWVIGAALVPAVIPALFVAVTSIVYFPLVYHWIAAAVTWERMSILVAADAMHHRDMV